MRSKGIAPAKMASEEIQLVHSKAFIQSLLNPHITGKSIWSANVKDVPIPFILRVGSEMRRLPEGETV